MQNGGDGYFVRLDAAPSARHAPVERGASAYSYAPSSTATYEPPKKKRKRRGFHVRLMPLLCLCLVGYLGWLQTQPGGVSGHVNDWIDKIRGGVESASTNPDLKRASEYFN